MNLNKEIHFPSFARIKEVFKGGMMTVAIVIGSLILGILLNYNNQTFSGFLFGSLSFGILSGVFLLVFRGIMLMWFESLSVFRKILITLIVGFISFAVFSFFAIVLAFASDACGVQDVAYLKKNGQCNMVPVARCRNDGTAAWYKTRCSEEEIRATKKIYQQIKEQQAEDSIRRDKERERRQLENLRRVNSSSL